MIDFSNVKQYLIMIPQKTKNAIFFLYTCINNEGSDKLLINAYIELRKKKIGKCCNLNRFLKQFKTNSLLLDNLEHFCS